MGYLRDRLARFMYGRYGMDKLNYVMFAVCMVFILVNSFLYSAVIRLATWAFLIVMIFRSFSRNTYKRRIENDRFLMLWRPVKAKGSLVARRIKDIGTHRYRRCPHCGAMLRLPRRRGKHTASCPRCKHEFKVSIRW